MNEWVKDNLRKSVDVADRNEKIMGIKYHKLYIEM